MILGASRIRKSPTDFQSVATQTKPADPALIESAQADLVCVAAISNRQVFSLNWAFF